MSPRERAAVLVVALVMTVAIVPRGLTAGDETLAAWLAGPTATGGWGGLRSALDEQGVTLSGGYTADFAGNVSGGERRGAAYAGVGELGLGVDLDRLARFPGSSLAVSGVWTTGRDLSADALGSLYPVQEIYAPGRFYLGQLSLSQSLFDDALTLQAGRLFASDVFATSPLWNYYVSGGIDGSLAGIESDIFLPAFPAASWGARAFYEPTSAWTLVAGAYDADATVAEPDRSGLDFGFDPSKGALVLGQLTYQHHQRRADGGLPGSVTVGGYYESSRFARLGDAAHRERGNYGLYLYGDQTLVRGEWLDYRGPMHLRTGSTAATRAKHPYVTRVANDRPTGPTLWGAVIVAPDSDVNPLTAQVAGGVLFYGLVPGRRRDVTGLAAIGSIFSDHLPGRDAEIVIEANHRIQLTPWCYATPDFQYVVHPNGFGRIRSAAVFAGEIGLTF